MRHLITVVRVVSIDLYEDPIDLYLYSEKQNETTLLPMRENSLTVLYAVARQSSEFWLPVLTLMMIRLALPSNNSSRILLMLHMMKVATVKEFKKEIGMEDRVRTQPRNYPTDDIVCLE